jgi:hypothetical protein
MSLCRGRGAHKPWTEDEAARAKMMMASAPQDVMMPDTEGYTNAEAPYTHQGLSARNEDGVRRRQPASRHAGASRRPCRRQQQQQEELQRASEHT